MKQIYFVTFNVQEKPSEPLNCRKRRQYVKNMNKKLGIFLEKVHVFSLKSFIIYTLLYKN